MFDNNEVLVIFHGTKEDLSPFYTCYEKKLPIEWQRLYVDGSMSQALKRAAETAGRYQFVLFINLIDPKDSEPYSNGVSLIYREMENLCGSRALIGNLLEEFAQDDRLGMMVPPIPNHGIYFEKVRNGMGGQEDALKVIAEKLGLQVPVRKSAAHPVFSWGGSFWIRAELLIRIIETYDTAGIEDSVLLMLMPYCLQEMRYFTGTVIGTHYASLEAANLDYMMRETNRAVFEKVGPDAYWVELRKLQESIN
jgi:rhamnosyltransferase